MSILPGREPFKDSMRFIKLPTALCKVLLLIRETDYRPNSPGKYSLKD
jgi:hypothetical protein